MERNKHNRENRSKSRTVFAAIVGLAIPSAAIYWTNFKIHRLVPMFSGLPDLYLYIAVFLFLSILYLIAVYLVIKPASGEGSVRGLTGFIVLSAIIFRLGLITQDPAVLSKDIYRYIWDGRVQQSGINPYLFPPGAVELEKLRDDKIFPNINRKDSPTLYPAGAQVFFRSFYRLVGDSVAGYKGIMVFFDILSLLVLTALLQAIRLSISRVIVYAWNPLVIFEIAYSGHLEGLTVFLVVAALYLHVIHQKFPANIMLALSAAVKLYPGLLLAALLNRGDRIKGIITFAAIILLLYLPFLGAGSKLAGFFPVYLKNPYESFNLGLKYLLMRLTPGLDYYLLSWLFIIALAIAGLLVLLKEKRDIQVLRFSYILTGLLLILMPASLHPWYVILIIPFLVIYPNPAWLVFSCTVTLSYLKYSSPQGIMPTWVLLSEYLLFFVMLTAGFILSKYNGRYSSGKKKLAGV
jgi:alpha-1,6-mannosyltransferase